MANRDAPSGLKVLKHLTGGEQNRLSRYHIATALASNIYRGDPVIPVNTSKNINVAAAGNRLQGVFDGVMYIDSNGDVQFRPRWATGTTLKTGTVSDAFVYDDPDTIFEIQAAGSIVAADIGTFMDVTMATSGNNATGQSGCEIDQTTIGTTDGQLKVLDLIERCDNAYGANAKVAVLINEHYSRAAVTAI